MERAVTQVIVSSLSVCRSSSREGFINTTILSQNNNVIQKERSMCQCSEKQTFLDVENFLINSGFKWFESFLYIKNFSVYVYGIIKYLPCFILILLSL